MYRKQLKQIDKMLSQTSTLTQNYKKVLMASMEHGDLETALYLRFLMELSVRSIDAVQITPDCVSGRKVKAACMKFHRTPYYLRPGGSFPVISKKTKQIADALVRKQGCYFTRSWEVYLHRIGKYAVEKEVSLLLHDLRRYRVLMEERLYLRRVSNRVYAGERKSDR